MAKAAEASVIENDDEIEIVADDDPSGTTAPAEVPAPADGGTPAASSTTDSDVDAAVAELKAQLEKERADRLAAVNAATDANARLEKAEGELKTFRSRDHENQFNLVVSQLEVVTKEADNVQTQLTAAYETGDFKTAAELQRKLGRLEARADQLEQGRDALEAAKVSPTEPDQNAQRVQPNASLDPVGEFITKLNLSQTDKDWLNRHRDSVTDQAKWNKLTATASYALNSKGLQPNSAEYYAFLDSELGYANPAPAAAIEQTEQKPPAPAPRQQPTYSAPPSREGSSMNGIRPKGQKIRLSPEQREAAKASGVSDAEYAKNLLNLVKSGQMPESIIQYVN